jgi:hypothetical protein
MIDRDRELLFHTACGVASLLAGIGCVPGLPGPVGNRLERAAVSLNEVLEKWFEAEKSFAMAKEGTANARPN